MSSSFISTVMVHDAICPKGQEFLFRPPKPDPNELLEEQETGYNGAETTAQALGIFSGVILLLLALMVGAVVVIGLAMGIAAICGA